MSEERRKINKQSTGTVPKIKYRNNTYLVNERERSQSLTNNLADCWFYPADLSNPVENPKEIRGNNYFNMDTSLEESNGQSIRNGTVNFDRYANGSVTPNTSSTSRRDSSSLKCDNVTKFPDKKQIEDKLHQIREYLKVTNSLMTSMKNTDDQTGEESEREGFEKMIKDLKDSEKKLVDILDQIQINCDDNKDLTNAQRIENGIDNTSECSTSSFRRNDIDINVINSSQEVDIFKDQQVALLKLHQKAENKLRDARRCQARLSSSQYGNDINDISHKGNKLYPESDFDVAIKELEDRAKSLRFSQASSNQKTQENILAKVESLHNQIMSMHQANDERECLIQTLDNRDTELRQQHVELQNKLQELQSKKLQVDQLVSQLHSFGEVEEEDVGGQVKKIVTMKDQLRKLKDMLELVKTTEDIMQNTNASAEAQAVAYDICTSAENFLEKDMQKPKLQSQVQHESNVLRNDNYTCASAGDNQPKQVNKHSMDYGCREVKPRLARLNEKLALQAELEAKKKELEEIMGKHSASTSNLNHDIATDVKSELSCASNTINEAWLPLIPTQSHHEDSDRFSSDDCQDINDYTEVHSNHNILNLPSSNCYSHTKTKKFHSVPVEGYVQSEYDRQSGVQISHTPDRNTRSRSAASLGYVREQPRSNAEQETRTQVEKQLQLIKSVCDSMLEQQSAMASQSNVQQLRNNLTPSPEPRRFISPHPHTMNALNTVNSNADSNWFAISNMHGSLPGDINNCQNWLATNTIQTQSFMLNTLNQCCQMLWLQQREIMSLSSTVALLQDRLEGNNPYGGHSDQLTSSLQTHQDQRPVPPDLRPVSNLNQKVNHVSAAFSLPNLNQYNAASPSNIDLNYINQNNAQSGRMLDPSLNNINHHLSVPQSVEHANNILHGVNSNINHPLPNQMWNGQALNNQVAPGNRANNYWDNFRRFFNGNFTFQLPTSFSYSRQNLLSTKNNDVLQTPPSLDRSNISNERGNPFSLMTFSKSNSEQDSTSTSQENTPQRKSRQEVRLRMSRHGNTNVSSVIPPPDVLNVNHNSKLNGHFDLSSSHQENNEDVNMGLMLLNLNSYNEACSNNSNISEEHTFKESIPEQSLTRNEWNDEVNEEQLPKTKLFDELRENVYKEVASLISANETRPHFLIQLFRDLQMIGSDSLRLKILQSIQMIITHSLMLSQNSNRQSLESQQTSSDQDSSQVPDYLSFQSTVWSKSVKNSSGIMINTTVPAEALNTFKEIVPFLNEHEDEVIQNTLLSSLKQILLNSEGFKETVRDTVFQKHFANVLDDLLEQYRGKKHSPAVFRGVLKRTVGCQFHFGFGLVCAEQKQDFPIIKDSENVQNGDLAEADQSRVVTANEEEGAVGGLLDNTQGSDTQTVVENSCEEVDIVDFSCSAEGLDQVPTRLPTIIKSRSATPNKVTSVIITSSLRRYSQVISQDRRVYSDIFSQIFSRTDVVWIYPERFSVRDIS
ncbi:hypothetical protein NQ315_013543 [Exocentrus adspersus]|uniref:Pericentriolar material 1 protein C-terminal domain-containing protein n=1 Tax=Exocentrus adspersus TaxID=1586481 RepID=A0AAV8V6D6_9CUCU|nr:hypothetical protein NQ315_013543 [Exocentrus adspersus]